MTTTRYTRKDRRDTVTGEALLGPVHLTSESGMGSLTLCGRRLKGFGVITSTEPLNGSRACPRCTDNAATGRQDSWKSR